MQRLLDTLALESDGLTEEEYEKLKMLIAKNADVFALERSELRYTDLVQHHVDTGGSRPIKQPICRVPSIFRNEIATMIREMESLGVIRQSSIAWSSPVLY